MTFTTRPDIAGTFGVVTSTHWIASAVGMGILERGGNAFDAAVAAGFVLQVVEPHLNGPGGEFPAILRLAGDPAPRVLCAQGVAPAGATIAQYRAQGLDAVPGSGLLASVVPGAFDGWMLLLRDHGTMTLREVLGPAIYHAERGHALLPRVAHTIAGLADFFAAEWPTSAAIWCPGGAAPQPRALFANPALAATWTRLLREAETARGREAQIEAARRIWSQGFVAQAIDAFLRTSELMDGAGARRRGVLTGQDMAGWQAGYEDPVSHTYHGWEVFKTGPWGQGPVLLQSLAILAHTAVAGMDTRSADFVHLVTEAMKLAYADREAFYGDGADVPLARLLSPDHTAARAALIGPRASLDQRPSRLAGFEALAEAAIARAQGAGGAAGIGGGEPTMAHLAERRGDTVHLDVIDRLGNMIAVTPSGGWLQSSPAIPGLGFCLNTRAQMFWLEEGLPQSLAPGRRPRTTLSPSFARGPGGEEMAFGTPGGDQQDQWQLIWFLRMVHAGMGLQQAIDAPLFHTAHFTGSFAPRVADPGSLVVEPAVGADVIADLRARGHRVDVAEDWSIGRLTAARRGPDGLLTAAATPRLMQAYAVGR
ncbi:MAG: gamma-glutamyltransferase family protein [Rhodobacteraceae bacterium]|nr:MAG: gamma-glutamyltransferase family protein [Paracoccaceae bacterium]